MHYRLKQTDFNGQFTYSEVRSVQTRKGSLQVYPNPGSGQVWVESNSADLSRLRLFTPDGRDITTAISFTAENSTVRTVYLGSLAPGLYWLVTPGAAQKLVVR
ncbi:MAG: T9SS type A sorting domain-containing protein [Bacteroidota bacterium]